MKRRLFVGGSLSSSVAAWAAPANKTVKAGDIPMRVFGKTGAKLTVIGQAGGRFPLITKDEAKAVARRAYELGINYLRQCPRLLGRQVGRSVWRGLARCSQEHLPHHQIRQAHPCGS